MSCKYNKAWVGDCKKDVVDGGFCEEHKKKTCIVCGNQATHECSETGQFVCGAPLCDDCEHTTFEDGTNGGIGFNAQKPPEGMNSHCKKSEQKFLPWYAQEEKKVK